jgi:hypothetical protein
MKKTALFVLCALAISLCGCDLSEIFLGDIGGWDLSTCGHYPGACWEFYWDNEEQFSGSMNSNPFF